MDLLMGIDLGSTSTKAVVYDAEGNMVASAAGKLPLTHDDPAHPAWCVWQPSDVWANVVEVIRGAAAKIPPGGKLKALAVTGFGMDGVPLDAAGNELFPFISWHCTRNLPQFERAQELLGEKLIFEETCKRPMLIDSIYRMMWMADNHPEILDATHKWLLIEDYVNYKLCGVMASDYSMSSTISALKQEDHTWSDTILNKLSVPRRILTDPMQSGTVLGRVLPDVCGLTGLSSDVLVVLGGHDYICAALALGIRDESEIADISGTWEMLVKGARSVKDYKYSDECFYIESHVAKDAYCLISSTVSGSIMEWARYNLSGGIDANSPKLWEELMAQAQAAPLGAHGCTLLPHFSGSNAPRVEPTSLGAFVGMNGLVTRGGMLRSVVEGLTYKTREMLESMTISSGLPRTMKVVGGAINNPFWMQAKADIMGISVEASGLYEATPLGAALLAGIGAGVYSSEDEAIAAVSKPGISYHPDAERHEAYTDLYQNIYLKLQDSLRDVNRSIFDRYLK